MLAALLLAAASPQVAVKINTPAVVMGMPRAQRIPRSIVGPRPATYSIRVRVRFHF